jgi:exosortase E/protease (VPEID-CTERM system)
LNREMSPCPNLASPPGHVWKPFPLARALAWLGVFLVEWWAITYQLRSGRLAGLADGPWVRIAAQIPTIMGVLIVALAVTVTFGWRGIRDELKRDRQTNRGLFGWAFPVAHLATFTAYLALTAWLLQGEADAFWSVVWAFMGLGSFALLGLAILPAEVWIELARRGWIAGLAGLGLGALAFFGGQLTVLWWQPLSDSTFWLVRLLLQLVTTDVVCEPSEFLIGTGTYQVIVGPLCSGYEGIGLIWAFLTAYLWLCRRALRFPQALLLYPIGTALMWLSNGLRIAALILIGAGWSPDVAERGFHSQAGWLAFNAVGLGLIAVSHRWGFFCRQHAAQPRVGQVNPAAPYLAPFVVLMAALMVCAALSAGFDYLYPVRFLAVAAALLWFRREYASWSWTWSWPAVGIGIVVFVAWLALEAIYPGVADENSFAQALENMPRGLAAMWLICRVLGSVVTVPLAEELAFRGFLIRRLQRADFQQVPSASFTWLSFLASSVLFGLLHDRWIAGIMAGMFYALALYRRGRLADAVLAHATTNALIAAYVLVSGSWSLWA